MLNCGNIRVLQDHQLSTHESIKGLSCHCLLPCPGALCHSSSGLFGVWPNRSLISKVLGKYLEVGGGLGAGCGYSLRLWTWWVLFIKDFGLEPKISSSQTLQCRLMSEPLAVWNILIVILGRLNRRKRDSKLMFSSNRNPEEILFLWNHGNHCLDRV